MTFARYARFLAKVGIHPETGCEVWLGRINNKGYGQVSIKGRKELTHRAMWEHHNGPIPSDVELDHLCHKANECQLGCVCPHRRCLTLSHLTLVPHEENVKRSVRERTHCRKGHLLLRGARGDCLECKRLAYYDGIGKTVLPRRAKGVCKLGHLIKGDNLYSRLTKDGKLEKRCLKCYQARIRTRRSKI